MQRTHDEVTGLGRRHADLDCFAVAHFTDQYDLGGLAQSRAESRCKGAEVIAHFALIECSLFLRMDEFDRVFERYDVNGLGFVQLVEQRGKCGGLTAAGCAGDEHEPGLFPRDRMEDRRQIELIDAWNLR